MSLGTHRYIPIGSTGPTCGHHLGVIKKLIALGF